MITPERLISICNPISVTGAIPVLEGRVQHDSRKVKPGDLFVAVSGLQADGHDYAGRAAGQGAPVIVAEHKVDLPGKAALIIVNDSRKLLGPLALAALDDPQKGLRLIGVTGTNGKTTVTTLVYQVLTLLGAKAALLGTVARIINGKQEDSKYTTADPVELAEDLRAIADAGTEFVSMEVSSHALDQDRVAGLTFEIAAFTNLTLDHLDYHKSMKAYAAAKRKLFGQVARQGKAVINEDDSYGPYMVENYQGKIYAFGQAPHCPYHLRINSSTASGLSMTVNSFPLETPLTGEFNAYNVCETFLICIALGFDPEDIARVLRTAKGAPGRLDRITIDADEAYPAVFVDYAHTPDALKKVAITLSEICSPNQKIAIVFGCGGDRDRSKRPLMGRVAEMYGDRVIITSDNPRTEDPEGIINEIYSGMKHPEMIERIPGRKEAIMYAITSSDADDIILIAGKGHENYQEINGKRYPFDDRKIAAEALRTWYNRHYKNAERN